jgi:hypothetical protein
MERAGKRVISKNMQQKNSTTSAPAQWAPQEISVPKRQAVAILHDLWDARRTLKRLAVHANNLAIIAAEMESEYTALQATADVDGNGDLLADLAVFGAEYVEICRQAESTNKEITDTTNRITALATEASAHGGVRV